MTKVDKFDVAIVGAGIVGLSHAWMAARHGASVLVCERDARACGASIRNFGMIWPIGQTPEGYATALRSRRLWLELAEAAGLWISPCGSLHLAHRQDEWLVLEEFESQAEQRGYQCRLLSPREVERKTPAAQPDGLLGGLWSPTELCVSPRMALARLPDWLTREHHVRFEFQTLIHRIEYPRLEASDGRCWEAGRILVCGGADLQTLFPAELAQAGLRRCKLQMLKTSPQPTGWSLGPHLAGGLTLRHYANFAECQSLVPLRQRIAAETPELDHYGIHVMAAQNDRGELVLGDSHEYDESITPFDREEVNRLLLGELHKILRLPHWDITERWHGIYVKQATQRSYVSEPRPGVQLVTGMGGAGMTMAFGLAEQYWRASDGTCSDGTRLLRGAEGLEN
jgi:D-hydroxyproline dehydrogenase subunit beta